MKLSPAPWQPKFMQVLDAEGKLVAQAQYRKDAQNVAMLAAGPELLAIMQLIMMDADSEPDGEYLQGVGKGRVAVHRVYIEQARQIIAKVTGEAS